MNKSESIVKISQALLKAQKNIKSVTKEANNPFFKSKYADLASVINACKDELNAEGIAVIQPIDGDHVETVLIHESGEWLSSRTRIELKLTKTTKPTGEMVEVISDPQAMGSAITYARRYGLQSFVFLPAVDDDGEAATRHETVIPRENGSTVVSSNKPVTPENDVMAAYHADNPICKSCGAKMVINPKTGNRFCENKCWLQAKADSDQPLH